MYEQIRQFVSVKPFRCVILAIHPKLMCKILSGSANHHRCPQHFWGQAGQVWTLVKSNVQLLPQFWERIPGVPWLFPWCQDSGNHSIKCEDFHLPDPREEKQTRAGWLGTISDSQHDSHGGS